MSGVGEHLGRHAPKTWFVRSIISAALSAAIAVYGIRARALTPRGGVAATLVGSLVVHGFQRSGVLLLGCFFATGSALARLPAARKYERGKVARTERQVLANGGVAALAGAAALAFDQSKVTALFAGSLAAATSDTWATEIGLQSGQQPRYILSGTPVPQGISGGVTPAGTIASCVGAFTIAGLTAVLYRRWLLLPVCLASGLAGSILDSVLGELVQRKRRALDSGEIIESASAAETQTVLISGLDWVDNDLVNLACTTAGGLLALALWSVAGQSSNETICGAARLANDRA